MSSNANRNHSRVSAIAGVTHTTLFLVLGAGTLLTYGLGTTSFSLPKWLFLLIAAAVIFCWSALRLLKQRSVAIDRADAFLLAFVSYGALSLLWAPDPKGGFSQLAGLCAVATLVVYAKYCDWTALVFRVSLLSLCATAIIVLRCFLYPGINGGFGNENYLSETLLLLCPFVGLWYLTRSQPDRWIAPALIACVVYVLFFMSDSRIEYLALPALAWCAAVSLMLRRNRRASALSIIAITLAGFVILTWIYHDRIFSIGSVVERLEIYFNSTALWLEQPVFGWGLGGFDYAYPRFQQFHLTVFPNFGQTVLPHIFTFVDFAHNELLHTLVELGIPGLILIVLLSVTVVRTVRTADLQTPLIAAAASGLVFLVVIGMISFPMRNPATAAIGALILGVLMKPKPGSSLIISIDVPRLGRSAAALLGVGTFGVTLVACMSIYMSGFHFAVSQALRDLAPSRAFAHMKQAHEYYPYSFQHRRQLYLTYVDWFAKARDKTKPLAADHELYFEIGRSTGPYSPGLLVTRIRFLLVLGLNPQHKTEIERHLRTLKERVPLIADIYTAEALYAQQIGDSARAKRAFVKAEKLKRAVK